MARTSIRQRLQAEGRTIFDDHLMQRAALYVARGRAHAELPTAEIKDRWVATFRSLVDESAGESSAAMEEYLCELSLRGELAPYDRVQNELEVLNHALATLEKNPEFQESMHTAIDEYRCRRAKPTN